MLISSRGAPHQDSTGMDILSCAVIDVGSYKEGFLLRHRNMEPSVAVEYRPSRLGSNRQLNFANINHRQPDRCVLE